MAALIALYKHRAVVANFRSPQDSRDQQVWPTDYAVVRGDYTPAFKLRRIIPAEYAVQLLPPNIAIPVYNEYTRSNSQVALTGSGPNPLQGIVPGDAIPHKPRGDHAYLFTPSQYQLADDLLDVHSPEYRRARLETLLWRDPQTCAQVMYCMNEQMNNRRRRAAANRQNYANRVQARMDNHDVMAVTYNGICMDYP